MPVRGDVADRRGHIHGMHSPCKDRADELGMRVLTEAEAAAATTTTAAAAARRRNHHPTAPPRRPAPADRR